MTLHQRLLRPVLVMALAAIFIGAPATVAVASDAIRTTPPPTEPAPEPASTEAPAPEQPPATEAPADDGTDGGTDWGPILIVAGLALVLIVIVGAILGRKSSPTPPAQPRTDPQQTSILSTSQWIHDQLTLELMAATPASARQRWTVERSRLDNVAISAQQQWTAGHGEAWQRLGQSMSALGASIETSIALREQQQPDPALVDEANQVVNRNRSNVQQLVSALWPAVQR